MYQTIKAVVEEGNATGITNFKRFNGVEWAVHVFGKVPVILRSNGIVDLKATFSGDWEFNHSMHGTVDVFNAYSIRNMLKFFAQNDWSTFCAKPQNKSNLNSGVPLLLYAQRLYNNIPYMAWKEELFSLKNLAILGKHLAGIGLDELPQFPEGRLLDLREQLYTSKNTGLKRNCTEWRIGKTDDPKFEILPGAYKRMITQSWIFNAACRTPNMILDWENWDNVPEAFDKVSSGTITSFFLDDSIKNKVDPKNVKYDVGF